MKKSAMAQAAPRGIEMCNSKPLTPSTALKDHMGLYQAPRVARVAQFFQQYGQRRPIPVAEILPVILMNYGEVEFRYARTWFEAGEDAPREARRSLPHRCGGGVWAGRIGVWFSPLYGDRDRAPGRHRRDGPTSCPGLRLAEHRALRHRRCHGVRTGKRQADPLIAVLCLLHLPGKVGVMRKIAGLLRPGGRAYLADFYAKGALSAQDWALLHDEVACPGLLTKDEYTGALQDAGFATVRFEDVTSEYAAFVHQRWTTYRHQNTSAQGDAVTRFYRAMDALYRSGDGASSPLGGMPSVPRALTR